MDTNKDTQDINKDTTLAFRKHTLDTRKDTLDIRLINSMLLLIYAKFSMIISMTANVGLETMGVLDLPQTIEIPDLHLPLLLQTIHQVIWTTEIVTEIRDHGTVKMIMIKDIIAEMIIRTWIEDHVTVTIIEEGIEVVDDETMIDIKMIEDMPTGIKDLEMMNTEKEVDKDIQIEGGDHHLKTFF